MTRSEPYDLAIVGGGLVGASLAVALRDSPLRIALIEAALPPASAPSWDERCIALNDGSRRIFEGMGVWKELAAVAEPITATHISERGKFGVSRFSAEEAGLVALGYNTPLRELGAVLMQRLRAAANLTLVCPAKLQAMTLGDGSMNLECQSAEGALNLDTRLVIAADGAGSAVRQLLGSAAEVRDYEQTAIVTAITVSRDPQGMAYERFTPEGPFAVLPKPRLPGDSRTGHICSLIWTLPHARAEQLKSVPDAEFLAAAEATFGERLGRFISVGKRIAWPLTRTVNEVPTASRVVFCGNASQSLHPVAAQGFNLGLRDVAALAESLREAAAKHEDPGQAERLSRYAASRAEDRRRTAGFTDQLVRVFSNRTPLLASLRHWGLLAVDLAPPLREAVLRQNLGHTGLRG